LSITILKEVAIAICSTCKDWGKNGCIAADIEGTKSRELIRPECMEVEAESKTEKIPSQNINTYNERDTINVHFPGVRGRDSIIVAKFFIEHPNEDFTPKQIANICHIGHESAKKICSRWYKKGRIQHALNHYYYAQKITANELEILQKIEKLGIHNLMLNVPRSSGDKRGVTPISGTVKNNTNSETISMNGRGVAAKWETLERKEYSSEQKPEEILYLDDLRGNPQCEIKIYEYQRNTIIHIGCSDNPLDLISCERVLGYIEGKGYSLKDAKVDRIEPHIDIPDLKISGANSVELRTFQTAWQRVYNKKGRLRKEIIIRGAHIPLEEVIAVLRGEQTLGTNTLAIQMIKDRKEHEQLKKALNIMKKY
jgi:hypothetical protein